MYVFGITHLSDSSIRIIRPDIRYPDITDEDMTCLDMTIQANDDVSSVICTWSF
jgi:hypothetical protein